MVVLNQNPSTGICDTVLSSQHASVALRVGGLFAILGGSATLTFLPLIIRGRFEKFNYLGSVFAAGVILATAFAHILPDADAAFRSPCLGFSETFPWAFVFAGASLIMLLVVENTAKQAYIKKIVGSASVSGNAGASRPEGVVAQAVDCEAETIDDSKAETDERMHRMNTTLAAIFLEGGIVFHSVFVGINYGVTEDDSSSIAVMIALIFHQAFDGLALGTAFVRAQFSTLKYVMFGIAFILVTPVGVAIGIGISRSYAAGSRASLACQGAFNSVSAGMLIYNGIVNLIVPLFDIEYLKKGPGLQIAAYMVLIAGYAAMAVVAKYA